MLRTTIGLVLYPTVMALLLGRADGSFARQPDLTMPWPESGPSIADVNGDGDVLHTGAAGTTLAPCLPVPIHPLAGGGFDAGVDA
jgi:hypothetical protein